MDRNIETLIEAIKNNYLPHLASSYKKWSTTGGGISDTAEQMIQDFADGLTYKKGRNYIKIISGRGRHASGLCQSVHSFIVCKPTKGFEIGDILKAASWKAPATNFKRGNVFCPALFAAVTWTGA